MAKTGEKNPKYSTPGYSRDTYATVEMSTMGSSHMKPKTSTNATGKLTGNAKKAAKQPTQKTPMEAIMVMGPTGKCTMQWRKWGS